MNKYKIYIYAICKNEEKFVDRWYESVKEADGIYVLDTGSTDNTVNKLKNLKVNVTIEEINPWRFDVARNKSLELVPKDADICVCIDLDEVLLPGWRKELEKIWKKNTTRLRYNYNWSLDENNNPLVNFYIEKIHSRNDYIWHHPVHEVLKNIHNNEAYEVTDDITVNHYPDSSKSRSNYLPLLELSVKECPEDDRNMHYLGREYMFYGKYNEAIDTLIKHLKLKSATWKDERCASMRFIARCYKYLKRYDESQMWLEKAIKEAPYLRESWMEMALLQYEIEDYQEVINYCLGALKVKNNPKSYISEPFSYDGTVYDLLSISYYRLNDIDNAIIYINRALDFKPKDERLINNKKIFLNRYNSIIS